MTALMVVPDLCLRAIGISVLTLDTISSNMPLKQLAVSELSNGRIPLWTSKLANGFSLLADSVSLPFDPREIWYLVLPRADAYLAMLLTGQAIGGLLMYWYLRRRHGLSLLASLVGAASYMFAGIFYDESRLHSTAMALDLLPGVIWLTERLFEQPSLKRVLHLGLGWGVVFLMASVAYGAFLPIVCFIWAGALWLAGPERDWYRVARVTVAYLGAGLWGIALSAYGLFPLLQFARQSNRGGEYVSDPYIYRSIFYGLFGAQKHSVLVPGFSSFFYFGTVALALAIIASGRKTSAHLRMLPWLSLAGFGGIAVLETGLKAKLGTVFHFILSIPVFRLSFFPVFAVAVLAAYGMHHLDWDLSGIRRAAVTILFWMQAAAIGGLALTLCVLLVLKNEAPAQDWNLLYDDSIAYVRPALEYPFLAFVAIRAVGLGLVLVRPASLVAARSQLRWPQALARARRTPLRMPPWRARMPRIPSPRQLAVVCLLAELILGWVTIRPLVSTPGAAHPFPITPELKYLKEHENANGRALYVTGAGRGPAYKPAPHRIADSLFLDAPGFNGLAVSNVYESLVVRNYARVFGDFLGQLAPSRAPTAVLLMKDPASRLLDAFGVRWIYSDQDLLPSKAYTLRFTGIAYNVYERLDTVPRAFFVGRSQRLGTTQTQTALRAVAAGSPDAPDLRREILLPGTGTSPPAGPDSYAPANITSDQDDALKLVVDAPTAGWVYLADTMYPGWQAFLDGRPARIDLADGYARAVRVGPGFHRIRFAFRPATFWVGLYLTLAALALSSALLAWQALSRSRRRRSPFTV